MGLYNCEPSILKQSFFIGTELKQITLFGRKSGLPQS